MPPPQLMGGLMFFHVQKAKCLLRIIDVFGLICEEGNTEIKLHTISEHEKMYVFMFEE